MAYILQWLFCGALTENMTSIGKMSFAKEGAHKRRDMLLWARIE